MKTSWVRTPPKTIIGMSFAVKISHAVKVRYWIARQLFTLGAWIINSEIVIGRETKL